VFDGISVNGYRYDVKETLRTLFASELFYDSAYRWAMVKHPVDYMMIPSRTIGLQDGGYVSRMPRYLEAMGMDILNPPDVNGWDHGRSWLYSGAMIARFNYANELSRSAIATDSWCDSLIPGTIASTSDNAGILAFFRDVLVQRTFRAQQETELMAFMAGIDDGAGSAQQKFRRKVRGALHLAMATPEYQLK
jgi:hypothetical protein